MRNGPLLKLDRCPHCGIAHPQLGNVHVMDTADHDGGETREWNLYRCTSCGGIVMTVSPYEIAKQQAKVGGPGQIRRRIDGDIVQMWPAPELPPEELPDRAKEFLAQAMDTVNAPVPSILAANAAIDAMFKAKGLRTGTLYDRIEDAAAQHLITVEMRAWAHEVRLDANDQRHADDDAPLPSRDDARKCILFAKALAEFLFVLPARVARGRGVAVKATKP